MRARRRRSVMNTISAAALEVAIMGLFVIIAQPQLRDALFEILQVDPLHATAQAPIQRGASDRSTSEQSVAGRSTTNATFGSATLSPAPALLSSQPLSTLPSTNPNERAASTAHHVASYSPYDQYESLRVTVPDNNHVANPLPSTQFSNPQYGSSQFNNSQFNNLQPNNSLFNNPQYAVPSYVPPQNYAAQNAYNVQNQLPTQLQANQWNIASAAQSPRTNVNSANGNANNWIPSSVTETSFRQPYPPPYGTQSMWK